MDFTQLIFFFLIIIPSAIIHEYAHGAMADRLGDPTAKDAGRLTLNPLAHIDLYGTILMPLFLLWASGGSFMFAYAKPVPYNPYNLKNKKWGPALVGIAGPASNLITAIFFGVLYQFLPVSNFSELIAIIAYANIILLVFNLVPIPPLDGSKILFALFPDSWDNIKIFLERFGIIIFLIFVFYFSWVITPITSWLFRLIVG
ncbi:MAG TPA: site-2 protease family protein [Patescibacteria group bacterium]|nr:site-2 protease family protein [Patescibacteria group bacterium]